MSWFVQQALAGNCFFGSTTNAGVAIPAYNATAQVFGIWNPSGSGVALVLNKLSVAVATLGTNAVAALGLSVLRPVGSVIATGSNITAFTDTTPQNARIGNARVSKARFTLSATVTAPTFLMSLPMAQNATTTQPVAEQAYSYDFGGSIIIPEGVYIGLGGSAAPGSTYQASISWAELPASILS
jgi:hypothetical protein